MEQMMINWLLGGFGTLIGFLLHVIWQAVKDLQSSDKDMTKKIASIEILVAGSYMTRSELTEIMKTVFTKLDRIECKLDKKVDRE
jgi:hypothetical protein|tara:strand:- start:582 stop:836 length:255 start_codon:yes stop_codon:yes gene_type:complete